MRRFGLLSLALAAAVAVAACEEDTPTTPTEPAPLVTETFSGSLTTNGGVTHLFKTAASGSVKATLATIGPEGASMGMSLGNWNGTTCQIVLANDKAVQGTVVTGSMSAAGDLCLRVYDADGSLAATVTYSINVEHP